MTEFSKLLLSISTMALLPLSATASQTGGIFVLPQGISYSKFAVALNISCPVAGSGALPTITQVNSPFLVETNQSIDGNGNSVRLLDGIDSPDTIVASLAHVATDNAIQVKADANAQWITMGTVATTDLQNYCRAELAWSANPIGDSPSSIFPVQPNPGINITVSRTALSSAFNCLSGSNWLNLNGSPQLKINYTFRITDSNQQNLSEIFTVQSIFSDGSESDCRNWSESPWIAE